MQNITILLSALFVGLTTGLLLATLQNDVTEKFTAPLLNTDTALTSPSEEDSLYNPLFAVEGLKDTASKTIASIHTATSMLTQPFTKKETVTMAWIYPYDPACTAPLEYSDGRKIDILKPEFFTINGGSLLPLDDTAVSCNGYSTTFITALKHYSTKQFATVSSASATDMSTFITQALVNETDINILVNTVTTSGLTGIELNFEDFGNWTPEQYADFKHLVTQLGNALQARGKELMVVGPPIANEIEQTWFVWRYEDFTSLPVDHMVVMGYDYQYDHGAGEAISPLWWLEEVINWTSARYPLEKITIGLPSYGYEGVLETHEFSILTSKQIESKPGYATATRDPQSAEMTWRTGEKVYFYQDSISLSTKYELVKSLGINSISVWHLGGNPWFENQETP